jgi:hypothetical protein
MVEVAVAAFGVAGTTVAGLAFGVARAIGVSVRVATAVGVATSAGTV